MPDFPHQSLWNLFSNIILFSHAVRKRIVVTFAFYNEVGPKGTATFACLEEFSAANLNGKTLAAQSLSFCGKWNILLVSAPKLSYQIER